MKKVIIIVLILVFCFFIIKFVPFGNKKAMMGASLIEIEVPKLSTLDSECCKFEATFKSMRSKSSLKGDFEKLLKKYMKVECDNNTYYYNTSGNYTILDYEIKGGFIFNKLHIKYETGNKCLDSLF